MTSLELTPHCLVWPRKGQRPLITRCLKVTTFRDDALQTLDKIMTELSSTLEKIKHHPLLHGNSSRLKEETYYRIAQSNTIFYGRTNTYTSTTTACVWIIYNILTKKWNSTIKTEKCTK